MRLCRNKKKVWCVFTCLVVFSVLSITGCKSAVSTAENDSPEELYSADPDIDLFVYEGTAYVNALDVDWVGEFPLDKGKALGKVTRSGITDDFQDWDATVLPEGTVIYTSDESQVLLAETEEAVIPYLKYVEG